MSIASADPQAYMPAEKQADKPLHASAHNRALSWLQSHKQSLQRKLQERQVEVQSKQEQLSSVLAESDAVRVAIASQTVNKDDVARMNQEKYAQT